MDLFRREKTDESLKIPLLDKALNILKKYDASYSSEGYLLPIYSNQKTNDSLKQIATQLKIRKKLSFHVARHTFATTVTFSNGVPIETFISVNDDWQKIALWVKSDNNGALFFQLKDANVDAVGNDFAIEDLIISTNPYIMPVWDQLLIQ